MFIAKPTRLAMAMLLPLTVFANFAIDAGAEVREIKPKELPADVFLQLARRPFRNNAWGRFAGIIQHQSDTLKAKMQIHMSVLFQEDLMRGQLVLDRHKLYGITQVYYAKGTPGTTLDIPENEEKPTLAELGVRAEDLAFSFLYWTPVAELEIDKVRGRECRVFKFRHPQTGERVTAWFSVDYLFPLKAVWFNPDKANEGADQAGRTLEFTDFERDGDLWYIKAFRLEGDGWKTRVKFVDGELHLCEDESPPPNLFLPRSALTK